MQNIIRKFSSVLRSDKFFAFVVILLIIQAVWVALSGQYPLAFDEDFHFGLIKLHAAQWSPFFAHSPAGSGAYGALTRDPSYLYHYLMSFPYRLVALLTRDEVHQIITLRFLNIAMFAAGLVALRHLLHKIGISRGLTNFSLLMLVVIPVVPILAAHINYDNLLFLLLPIALSLALTCGRTLQQDDRLPAIPFLSLIVLSLLTTLVKYVFLPVLLAISLYLLVIFWGRPRKKQVFMDFFRSFAQLRPLIKAALVIGLLVSGGLFIERDVVNIVKYHAITPSCTKVESVAHCMQYGPWARDYTYAQQIQNGVMPQPNPNPFAYAINWAHDLLYRLFFAINYDYSTKPPLLIPYRVAAVLGFFGILFLCFWGRRIIYRYRGLVLPLLATLIYSAALFYENYTAYLKYGERVAVNGRYLIPLLPFIFVLIGLAYAYFLKRIHQPWEWLTRAALVLATLLMIVQGGGILTFIAESEPGWYWQNDHVIGFNQEAQRLVTTFIVGLH